MLLTIKGGRRRPRRILLAIMATGALCISAAGCGSDSGNSGESVTEIPSASGSEALAPQPLKEPFTMQLGISKLEAYADALVAEQLGEFEKENLKVEFNFIPASESLLLVTQGKLDASGGAVTAGILNMVGGGADIRIVYPSQGVKPDQTDRGWFINTDVINPDGGDLVASDFLGKKLLTAAGGGSPQGAYLYKYIASLPGGDKIDAKELEFEDAGDQKVTVSALESGAIGAGKVDPPNNQTILDNDCCELLPNVIPSEGAGYVFGPSMKDRADVGAAFVRAMARTRQTFLAGDYRKNAETNAALASALEVDPKVLGSLPPNYFDPEFDLSEDANASLQEFYRDRDLLTYDKDLAASDIYDARYLSAAGLGSN